MVNCCPMVGGPELKRALPPGSNVMAPKPARLQKLQYRRFGACAASTGIPLNGAGSAAPKPAVGPNFTPPGSVPFAITFPGLAGLNAATANPEGTTRPHQRLPTVSTTRAVYSPRAEASAWVLWIPL